MLDQILQAFPAHTHPLTLMSDPDGVLLSEQVLTALAERGFRLINEADPVALRYQVQRAQPFSAESPVIIITSEPLNTLPYDLWEQGHHVTLDLHRLFPHLAYPILRQLSPAQRERLSQAQAHAPQIDLSGSQRRTMEYLLRQVFGIAPEPSLRPAELIAWLDDYHRGNDPLPPSPLEHLLSQLKACAQFAAWPLESLLTSAESFQDFVQHAWARYVGATVRDSRVDYHVAPTLPFETDSDLQVLMPRLVRSGTLTPVVLDAPGLPAWLQVAVVQDESEIHARQFAAGLQGLTQQLAAGAARWEQWQAIARQWAQLTVWRYDPHVSHSPERAQQFLQMRTALDDLFYQWLALNYAALAGRVLPTPHHLYHVPTWLSERRQASHTRQALIVLDGMALADWLLIRAAWQARRPAWRIQDTLVLAQIPSITAIARQALISGRKPAYFADSIRDNRREAQHWTNFWDAQGSSPVAAGYAQLPTTRDAPFPDVIDSRRTQALCLISTIIDDMIHGSTQGLAGLRAALDVWLQQHDGEHQSARWIETLIQRLLTHGYTVTLATDHGHTEARGIGQPQEGVVAVTRSKRARLYDDVAVARAVQARFPDTILWTGDDLLPPHLSVMMPQGRRAFAPQGVQVVSHGGCTIDEMIVPLITITTS